MLNLSTVAPDLLAEVTGAEVIPASLLDGKRDRTRGELETAFNLVCRKDDWKMPVNAEAALTESEREDVATAVEFYTGGVAQFRDCGAVVTYTREGKPVSKRFYRVTAPGYYVSTGA